MSFISELLGHALTAVFVSALLAPWLLRNPERRKVRAEVHKYLAAVEHERWATHDAVRSEFLKIVRDLEAAALIARIPRRVVKHYTALADTCWRCSYEDSQEGSGGAWEISDRPEIRGSIPSWLSDRMEDAADLLVEGMWSPLRVRITMRRKLKRLQAAIEAGLVEQSYDPFGNLTSEAPVRNRWRFEPVRKLAPHIRWPGEDEAKQEKNERRTMRLGKNRRRSVPPRGPEMGERPELRKARMPRH